MANQDDRSQIVKDLTQRVRAMGQPQSAPARPQSDIPPTPARRPQDPMRLRDIQSWRPLAGSSRTEAAAPTAPAPAVTPPPGSPRVQRAAQPGTIDNLNSFLKRRGSLLLAGTSAVVGAVLVGALAMVLSPSQDSDDQEASDNVAAAPLKNEPEREVWDVNKPITYSPDNVGAVIRQEADNLHQPAPVRPARGQIVTAHKRASLRPTFTAEAARMQREHNLTRWLRNRKDDARALISRIPSVPAFSQELHAAITTDAKQKGLKPEMMMRLIGKESGGDSNAKSDTTALGTCQFVEQTFLGVVSQHGHTFGLKEYADKIYRAKDKQGNTWWTTGDRSVDRSLLALRSNNNVSIPACSAFVKGNITDMQKSLGNRVNFTDVSIAHMTNTQVAIDMHKAYHDPSRQKISAYQFAQPVHYNSSWTNRALFFKGGDKSKPYSVAEYYNNAARRMTLEPVYGTSPQQQVANSGEPARLPPR